MNQIDFNDLPDYIDWPKKIIENSDLKIRYKTKEEIFREFGDEKWAYINSVLEDNSGIDLNQLEFLLNENIKKNISVVEGKFFQIKNSKVNEMHDEIIEEHLTKYSKYCETIVEIGAGYGSKILKLASKDKFSKNRFIAGELTQQGQNIIKKLALNMGVDVKVGYCDISNGDYNELGIPKNSIIYSCYSAHYVPDFQTSIYKMILKLKPSRILHFEPIYESFSSNKVYDLFCRKYIEINNYNTNLLSTINSLKEANFLDYQIKKNIIGSNPFLPISVIDCIPNL